MREINKTFSIAKAIALLSIVTAHTSFQTCGPVLSALISRFSSMGVIVFIVSSGFYFSPDKSIDLFEFLKHKIRTLFVPWFVCGSIVYLEARIAMSKSFLPMEYIEFLVGKNSYLYYMTVLTIIYVLLYYPVKNGYITVLFAMMVATSVSQILTANRVIDVTILGITDYLNIFNWIGYFCIGVIINKYTNVARLLKTIQRLLPFLILCWLGVFWLAMRANDSTGYFSRFAIPLQLLSTSIFFGVSSLKFMHRKWLILVADYSYFVYLVHMAVIPIVYKCFGGIYILNLFAPVITIVMIVLPVKLIEKYICKINNRKINVWFYTLSGIRCRRV